jgi:hypothetical protein
MRWRMTNEDGLYLQDFPNRLGVEGLRDWLIEGDIYFLVFFVVVSYKMYLVKWCKGNSYQLVSTDEDEDEDERER